MDFYQKYKNVILSGAKRNEESELSRSSNLQILRFAQNDTHCAFIFSLILLFFSPSLRAQTAQEMAKELETMYRRDAGTAISYSLDGAKNSLTFSNTVSKFRIESPDDLIVSDGTTIWHLNKKNKEVVIDKISSKGSSLATAEELLKFSTNYSSVLAHKKNIYELSLAPNANISKLMESIGGISLLTFTFTKTKAKIDIKKISARSANKNYSIGNIKIRSFSKLENSLFTYQAPKNVKVIDLRE